MIRFTGGTSGCRKDYLPNVPDAGSPQPILNTERSGAVAANLQTTQTSGNRADATPDMPTGAGATPELGGSNSDLVQQDIVGASRGDIYAEPPNVFKGAPNRGTAGGPA